MKAFDWFERLLNSVADHGSELEQRLSHLKSLLQRG
jgi:hypothetical protein